MLLHTLSMLRPYSISKMKRSFYKVLLVVCLVIFNLLQTAKLLQVKDHNMINDESFSNFENGTWYLGTVCLRRYIFVTGTVEYTLVRAILVARDDNIFNNKAFLFSYLFFVSFFLSSFQCRTL